MKIGQDACLNCTSGGVCQCSTKQCICNPGFVDSPTGNDCACIFFYFV